MASLAQLLAHHGCILVADAASTCVQVGLLRAGQPALWRRSEDEAGKALFALTEASLADAGLRLAEVPAFAFCAGPGSMLGARTIAMALRTWQVLGPRPAFAYSSLELLARSLAAAGAGRPFAVITDARRDTWNLITVDSRGALSPLTRAASADVAASAMPVYCPTSFRAFAPPPVATLDCAYDVGAALERFPDADLFSEAAAPDSFQHEPPDYKKWSSQVHSAATAPRK